MRGERERTGFWIRDFPRRDLGADGDRSRFRVLDCELRLDVPREDLSDFCGFESESVVKLPFLCRSV